jgi:hypothetical protein
MAWPAAAMLAHARSVTANAEGSAPLEVNEILV